MWNCYIDILKGMPKNHWGNAFIMQSDENCKKVLSYAETLIKSYNCNKTEAITIALNQYNLDLNLDFTDPDAQIIRKWVKGDEVDFLKKF